MKNRILLLCVFFLAAVHAFTLGPSLRRGFYRAKDSADEIMIMPDTAFDVKADGFRPRYEYYGVSAWSGPVRNENMVFIATGTITGDELRIVVQDAAVMYEASGGLSAVSIGEQIIFTIINHETFTDASGREWAWRRDNRGY